MQFKRLPPYFPKQLYLRFVLMQVFGVVPAYFLALFLAHYYLDKHLPGTQSMAEAMPFVDSSLVLLGLVTAALVLGMALWTGYRLVLPLGRILVKARSIQRYEESREEEVTGVEEPSEWSDLETTLHKIGRELKSKDRSLTRERDEVETMMSALTEAVAAVDKSGSLLFFNSKFALLFGFGQGGQGTRLSDFIRSPDVVEAYRDTIKDGAARQINTSIRIPGENLQRFFSLSIAPLRQGKQELYGAIGVFHDLSELRRMDQVRIDFVANVSHELRTPLTAIKGYAEAMKGDTAEGSALRKYSETIERNTDRLINLVHDLLNLSTIESGTELEQQEIDLKELTSRVLSQVESLRAAREQEITSTVETPKLWADPKRVEQVLFNLLENSIKYVPAKGKISVRWGMVGDGVQLRVIDNGPGIPLEHQARVFERFYRVDSARSRDQGGTGLGLAIVKHIMQRHGGKVHVKTGPHGSGADFLCTFPLERLN